MERQGLKTEKVKEQGMAYSSKYEEGGSEAQGRGWPWLGREGSYSIQQKGRRKERVKIGEVCRSGNGKVR